MAKSNLEIHSVTHSINHGLKNWKENGLIQDRKRKTSQNFYSETEGGSVSFYLQNFTDYIFYFIFIRNLSNNKSNLFSNNAAYN